MSIVLIEKTVDIAVAFNGRTATGKVHALNDVLKGKPNRLRLYCSLLGETEPVLSPLTTEYTFGDRAPAYRYDWVVGISSVKSHEQEWWWDWMAKIREERALAVQLLVDSNGSGYTVSEFAAYLLGLHPSMDTASWFEKNSEGLGNALREAASLAEPISERAASVLNASALMSNFITASNSKAKHWFIYRFLDEQKQCMGIEWNIHRTVLHQYGSLLRGSMVLSFHGAFDEKKRMRLLLRPRLGFGGNAKKLNYLPEHKELEGDAAVTLEIAPKSGNDARGIRETS